MEAIKRLTRSLCRFLSPEAALQSQAASEGQNVPLTFLKTVPLGGAYLFRSVWEMLGLHAVLKDRLKERSFMSPVEWAAFAMAANQALAPDSKRGISGSAAVRQCGSAAVGGGISEAPALLFER